MTAALANLAARLRTCRGVLVDSNVLLDVATDDAEWGDWSSRARAECGDQTALVIEAHLPDFYIGAHAAIERLALLTRDVARYRTYFPTIELLGPS